MEMILSTQQVLFSEKTFRTRFNIGLRNPKTGNCLKCLSLTKCIKRANNAMIINRFLTDQKVYKLKSNELYRLLKQKKEKPISFL